MVGLGPLVRREWWPAVVFVNVVLGERFAPLNFDLVGPIEMVESEGTPVVCAPHKLNFDEIWLNGFFF